MDFSEAVDAVIVQHLQELKKPGVLSIRPGYAVVGGWPTKKKAIVVTVERKCDDLSPADRLPENLGGYPVDVRQAGVLHSLRNSNPSLYVGVAAAVRPELDRPEFKFERDANGNLLSPLAARVEALRKPRKEEIEYEAPGLPLDPIEARMKITCHASPDAGWPTLKAFFAATTRGLTVGMYDFTSTHIMQAVEAALGGDGRALNLVLDHPPGKASREQTIDTTVEDLEAALRGRMKFAWALERNDPKVPAYIFPSAYHIKVAVRDSSAVWISSGNWNSSNQPEIDPIQDPTGSAEVAANSDRDWHVVIENQGLARLFEEYLLNDLDVAEAHQAVKASDVATALAAMSEVIDDEAELAARAPVTYFPPLTISGRFKVQPFLTPDNYIDCILPLIESAKRKFYMQTQYIHPTDKDDGDSEKLRNLIGAIKKKIDDGVDVKLILSTYENAEWLEVLQSVGLDLSCVKIQPRVHNKGMIVDSEVVVVSSQNWSGAGVSSNRDAGVIIYSEEAAQYWEKIFLHDWKYMTQRKSGDGEPARFRSGSDAETRLGMAAAGLADGRGDSLEQQLSALGQAQVLVVLKDVSTTDTTPAQAALAAAIPVASSKHLGGMAQATVIDLGKHFRCSQTSTDSLMALSEKSHKIKSEGLKWYAKAESSANPTPPVRYFPNLGAVLGTTDRAGVAALRADPRVDRVFAPPAISLIRPVAASDAKVSGDTTWGIKRLKADKAHKCGYTGKGVIVGHLDTGVDGKHPALKDAIAAFTEFDMLGFEVSPTPQPHDTGEHGSHTAGTIAGRTGGIGVAPGAKLASAIVIEGGSVIARILAGMDWIIGQKARILSMSLGLRGYTDSFLSLTQLLRQRGVLPVFAVGNEGPGQSRSPGNYVEALSVGAMDENDQVADFSGSQVFDRADNPLVPDLVAPGVDVISAKVDGGYQQMSGTSMATPHIAGLAALLMEAKPEASIAQIERAIFDSCIVLPSEQHERQNRGVPDAIKALALLGVRCHDASNVQNGGDAGDSPSSNGRRRSNRKREPARKKKLSRKK